MGTEVLAIEQRRAAWIAAGERRTIMDDATGWSVARERGVLLMRRRTLAELLDHLEDQ